MTLLDGVQLIFFGLERSWSGDQLQQQTNQILGIISQSGLPVKQYP